MKLKDYIKHLQVLADAYPEAELVCSSDDEGNDFPAVHYFPAPGICEDRYWTPLTPDDEDCPCRNPEDVTHVCLN